MHSKSSYKYGVGKKKTFKDINMKIHLFMPFIWEWVKYLFFGDCHVIKCGDKNFIIIIFFFLNNMLGLILNFECSLDLLLESFSQKIKLCKFHYMSICSIHIYSIIYLLGKMSTIQTIYHFFPWFVEHSRNEYFIKSFFLVKYNIFHLSKLHDE
jgi:hypothetical protein